MSAPLIVKVPPRFGLIGGVPSRELQVVGSWAMNGGRIGIWLAIPGERTGQRWPVTGVTADEVKSWSASPETDEA